MMNLNETKDSSITVPPIPSLQFNFTVGGNETGNPMDTTRTSSWLDQDGQKSHIEAMRIKKHFTTQTSLMLRNNETSFVGAFAVSQELRTTKKSPLSCLLQ